MHEPIMPFRCVGIVGLGLIGGSLALDLQSKGCEIHGLVHRQSTKEKATARGLAQVVSTDPDVLAGCDLVILALPLEEILKPPSNLINALPQEAVITDVGSVKAPVIETWQKLHPLFVGSHPMAGNTDSGVDAGQIGLFRERPWVCTPTTRTNSYALEIVKKLALTLGGKWVTAEAKKHDQAVALISHLPVVISAALLRTLGNERDPDLRELSKSLASSGFMDTTRVGGGNPELGTSMATYNRAALLKALSSYRWSLEELEGTIISKHWAQLNAELELTKELRSTYGHNQQGNPQGAMFN